MHQKTHDYGVHTHTYTHTHTEMQLCRIYTIETKTACSHAQWLRSVTAWDEMIDTRLCD